jgi:cold shock CspA family protein/uncharacterized membrane protein YsdA (DUF1294 family)
MKGTVVDFNDSKGYGFIQPDGQQDQIFVHASAVTNRARLADGQRVTFDVVSAEKGPRASNVVIAGAAAPARARRNSSVSPYLLFGLVAAAITAGIMLALIGIFNWSWLWSYLIGINAATLLLYGYDKSIAGGNALRVPERVLHGAELFGGTPAGFIGQRVFHHKSRKGSYQLQFWLIVAAQAIAVIAIVYLGLA